MSKDWTVDVFDGTHQGQTDLSNIEKNLNCLKSSFSAATEPTIGVEAGMFWYDTTANILKIRNEANTAWLSIFDFANSKPIITNLSNEITGAMISSAIKDPAVATAGLRTLGTGSLQACAGNDPRLGILANKQVFTSNGTFYRPSGVTQVVVFAVGSGGGGGGGYTDLYSTVRGGGGGGSGEVIWKTIDLTSYAQVTVTIGNAGSGGSAGSNGTAGANITFGSLLTAKGGNFGYGATTGAPGSGALAGTPTLISSNTDIIYSGGPGGGSSGDNNGYGGSGGSPQTGFGAGGVGDQGSGNAGTVYGGAGAGGGADLSQAYAGGNGAKGVLIVRW